MFYSRFSLGWGCIDVAADGATEDYDVGCTQNLCNFICIIYPVLVPL